VDSLSSTADSARKFVSYRKNMPSASPRRFSFPARKKRILLVLASSANGKAYAIRNPRVLRGRIRLLWFTYLSARKILSDLRLLKPLRLMTALSFRRRVRQGDVFGLFTVVKFDLAGVSGVDGEAIKRKGYKETVFTVHPRIMEEVFEQRLNAESLRFFDEVDVVFIRQPRKLVSSRFWKREGGHSSENHGFRCWLYPDYCMPSILDEAEQNYQVLYDTAFDVIQRVASQLPEKKFSISGWPPALTG